MLDHETIKRFKRDLIVNDQRGGMESVEFHVHEFVYLNGVEDGMKVSGLDDTEIARLIAMVG